MPNLRRLHRLHLVSVEARSPNREPNLWGNSKPVHEVKGGRLKQLPKVNKGQQEGDRPLHLDSCTLDSARKGGPYRARYYCAS